MKRKRELELLTPTRSNTPKKPKFNPVVKEEESTLSVAATLASTMPSPASSSYDSQPVSPASSAADGTLSTDATSVDEDTIIVEPLLVNPAISKLKKPRGGKLPRPLEQAKSGDAILVGDSTSTKHPAVLSDCSSILSELPSEFELDDSKMTITPKTDTPKNRGTKRKRRMESPTTDLDHAPAVRVPGDYVLTAALLAEPESSWIICKICEEAFVQKDAYFTRSSCPRCERHSKLYGYMWPKTDKEGKNDTEERVLDHRTVHRFIDPSEERTIRKRDRGSTGSRAVTREVSEAVEEEGPRGRRKRAKRDRSTL
jgi:histone-lysine N-methyltransferase SUV420H